MELPEIDKLVNVPSSVHNLVSDDWDRVVSGRAIKEAAEFIRSLQQERDTCADVAAQLRRENSILTSRVEQSKMENSRLSAIIGQRDSLIEQYKRQLEARP